MRCPQSDAFPAGGAGGAATSAAWALQAVDSELDNIEIPVPQNSISIMCLPFAAEGISARNADMKAYTIAWIPKLTPTVYLQRKDSFAAGEPFILLVGKPSAESTAVGDL